MATIHVLDESIAQKIAAGEVVERPSSVVKELVENSIDAGSTFITVEIREGGIEYLRVTDNGCGIPQDEIELAFLRHATSKIQSLSDLYNIRQMGFRGEALYSIAAVAKLELTTKPAAQPSGARLIIHGGRKQSCAQFGCPDGTTIVLSDLFYNTPARLKFLSKPAVEAGYIGTVITRLILANPSVSIKFVNNGKVIYHSTGDGILINAIYIVFGKEIASHLLPVQQTIGMTSISGFLFAPGDARGNRSSQFLMVNSRPILSQQVSSVVERFYAGLADSRRFPGFVLNISLPPVDVDVNVHPNKLQVRFANDATIRQLVETAVSKAIDGYTARTVAWTFAEEAPPRKESQEFIVPSPSALTDASPMPLASTVIQSGEVVATSAPRLPEPVERLDETVHKFTQNVRSALAGGYSGYRRSFDIPVSLSQTHSIQNASRESAPVHEPLFPSAMTKHKVIGQAFGMYALVEYEERLLIIDQHAAHERLIYEQYRSALDQNKPCAQSLLIPQTLNVSFEVKTAIDANLALLFELGFEIEEYGKLGYQVRTVPFILGQPQVADLLLQIVDELLDDRSVRTTELKKEKIMSMACKKAVKAGDTLSQSELDQLIQLIGKESIPLTCPHGRPFVISMEKHDMDRQFRRVK